MPLSADGADTPYLLGVTMEWSAWLPFVEQKIFQQKAWLALNPPFDNIDDYTLCKWHQHDLVAKAIILQHIPYDLYSILPHDRHAWEWITELWQFINRPGGAGSGGDDVSTSDPQLRHPRWPRWRPSIEEELDRLLTDDQTTHSTPTATEVHLPPSSQCASSSGISSSRRIIAYADDILVCDAPAQTYTTL